MLSTAAWNAFLKTLEEPPPNTVFVLATTEAQKVPADRRRPLPPLRLPAPDRRADRDGGRTQRGGRVDRDRAARRSPLLARHASGSFRDALGTLEQLVRPTRAGEIALGDVLAVLGVSDAELLFEAFDAIAAADPRRALAAASGAVDSGHDPAAFIRELEIHARELLVVQMEGDGSLGAEPHARARRAARRAGRAPGLRRPGPHARPAGRGTDPPARGRRRAHPAGARARQGGARRPRPQPRRADGADRAARAGRSAGARRSAAHSPTERGRAPCADLRAVGRPGAGAPRAGRRDQRAGGQRRPAARAPGTGAAPAPLSLERLVGMWPDVLDTVRAGNAMLGAVVDIARPVELAGDRLVLAFGEDDPFLRQKAEERATRAALAEAVRAVTGHALTFTYELREGHGPPAPAALSEDELVARLKDEFGAEELPGNDEEDD